MKKKLLLLVAVIFALATSAQVAINPTGASPDPSSGLDIDFNNKGLLMPRLTTAERDLIANPAEGLIIYNTDCGTINLNAGSSASPNWVIIYSANSLLASVNITANPVGALCQGNTVTYTAVITNGGNAPTYQWKRNGGDISGENSSTFFNSSPVNGDVISCVITSNEPCVTGSPATSNSIAEIVNPTLGASATITVSPTGSVCQSELVSFTATPTNGGAVPAYQWKNNGADISGANGATFLTGSLDDGDQISCVVTSNLACVTGSPSTSNTINMVIDAIPATPGSITGSTSVCPNSTGNNYSISVVNDATSYNWTVPSGASITNDQGTSIQMSFGSNVTGNITVTASNYCGTSNAASITTSQASAGATGGTISTVGSYTVHTFTSSGTFNVTGCSMNVEYLVVAGGGGGGDGNAPGGGGGGGGFVEGTTTVTSGAITVTVGDGGNGGCCDLPGNPGENSVFGSIVAVGGGRGGGYQGNDGGNGGSGGGGSGPGGYGGSHLGGTSTQTSPSGGFGYGNSGGNNDGSSSQGGGGGGAAGAGTRPHGGAGRASSISGTSVYYAGGGGGAGYSGGTPGTGGIGGGGNGGNGSNGSAGVANTGGGGGGSPDQTGGKGGSGIVIIRYLN